VEEGKRLRAQATETGRPGDGARPQPELLLRRQGGEILVDGRQGAVADGVLGERCSPFRVRGRAIRIWGLAKTDGRCLSTTALAAGVSRISPIGVVAVLSGGAATATPETPISNVAARAVRMGRMVGLFSRVVGLMMAHSGAKATLNRT
jgi:hypothetical protein